MRASFSNACSEDVMARARQGALTANEWEGFTHHLATCAECRVTWQVMIAFQQSAAPMCGDERILKRACQLALIGSRDKRSPPTGPASALLRPHTFWSQGLPTQPHKSVFANLQGLSSGPLR